MELVSPLVSGIAGAEDGTVDIYRRGTTSRATHYLNYEGTSAASGQVDLNSRGQVVVYVNEPVTVVVNSSSASGILSFDYGHASPLVEVRSQSFVGADYTTAQAGAGKPLTLQSVLDMWEDSAGTTNFNVMVGGSAVSLTEAVIGLGWYHVTSSAYGAIGDGVVDDAASVQAAIDAAAADGGGTVYLAPGTYKIGTVLDVPAAVTLRGSDDLTSTLTTAANNNVVGMGASGGTAKLEYLKVTTTGASTGKCVVGTDAAGRCEIWNCYIRANGSIAADFGTTSTGNEILCVGTHFQSDAATGYALTTPSSATTGLALVIGCKFVVTRNEATCIKAYNASIVGCHIEVQTDSMEAWCVEVLGGQTYGTSVTGCNFVGDNSARANGFKLVTNTRFYESGNVFTDGQFNEIYDVSTLPDRTDALNCFYLGSREGRRTYETQSGAATFTVDALGAAVHVFQISDAGTAKTINIAELPPLGHRFKLFIYNSNVADTGVVTVTASGTIRGHTPAAIVAGTVKVLDIAVENVSGTNRAYVISEPALTA